MSIPVPSRARLSSTARVIHIRLLPRRFGEDGGMGLPTLVARIQWPRFSLMARPTTRSELPPV